MLTAGRKKAPVEEEVVLDWGFGYSIRSEVNTVA
jgi:hypothetical protein